VRIALACGEFAGKKRPDALLTEPALLLPENALPMFIEF
jgi:hypothetical protein